MKRINVGWIALAAAAIIVLANEAKADGAAALATLPPELQALYVGAEKNVQPSAYGGYKMPPKPWKWCHSESYQGNPWRVTVTNELKRLVEGLKDVGIDATFEVSDSNSDAAQQINQIRAFIDKKCTVITSIAG